MKYDFFLAHAEADAGAATELYAYLSRQYNVFLDSKTLLPGALWDVEINRAQRMSEVTVVLISSKSDATYYQQEEIAGAISLFRQSRGDHRVVPLYLDHLSLAREDIPYGLRRIHGISVHEVGSLEEVARKLSAMLETVRRSVARPTNYFETSLNEEVHTSESIVPPPVDLKDFSTQLSYFLKELLITPAIQQILGATDHLGPIDSIREIIRLHVSRRLFDKRTGHPFAILQDALGNSFIDQESLRLVLEAARLASSVIEHDQTQVTSQLIGRLLPHTDRPMIGQLIDALSRTASRPWLRPQREGLHYPHTGLFRMIGKRNTKKSLFFVTISSDGTRAMSASHDNVLSIYDLNAGSEILSINLSNERILGVAASLESNLAVSASYNSLTVWNLKTGNSLQSAATNYTRDLFMAITHDQGHVVCVSQADYSSKVSLFTLTSLQEVWSMELGFSSPSALAVSPVGPLLAVGLWNGTLELRDIESFRLLHTSKASTKVYSATFTLDGRHMISGHEDGSLKLWDLANFSEVGRLVGHNGNILGIAVTATGNAVSISADQMLKIWNLKDCRELQTLHAGSSEYFGRVATTPDGKRLLSTSDDVLKIWDLSPDQELRVLLGHSSTVAALACTRKRDCVISASADHTLKVWDIASARELGTLAGHSDKVGGVTVTPNGRYALSSSYDTCMKLWDLETFQNVRTFRGHTQEVYDAAISPNGQIAISASRDKTLKVWSLESGRALRTLEGHTDPVYNVVITPNGRCAISSSYDKTLKVWDIDSGRELRTLRGHTESVYRVDVRPDGRQAVSYSADKTIKLWDIETGRVLRSLDVTPNSILIATLTPDGRVAAFGYYEGTIALVDLDTGRKIRNLDAHDDRVGDITISPDGRFILSCSADKTLKLWDIENGALLTTFYCDAPVRCCSFADNTSVLAGDDLGSVHIFSLLT